ncbi:hypothetical protein PHMEG_00036758, partial [Phytophthora megakarya]
FSFYCSESYAAYHLTNPFPKTPDEKRAILSRFVSEAWKAVPALTIKKGFIRAGITPYGPRDKENKFHVGQVSGVDAPVVEETDESA